VIFSNPTTTVTTQNSHTAVS